jgi:hypothetical protein
MNHTSTLPELTAHYTELAHQAQAKGDQAFYLILIAKADHFWRTHLKTKKT